LADGQLRYDPLNFELPNLAHGAYPSSVPERKAAGAVAGGSMTDGSMFSDLANAIDADSIANDWAAFSTADGTVHADWIVTLPGQYVMTNPLCDTYTKYDDGSATAGAICSSSTAVAAYTGTSDRNQLPLLVASNKGGDPAIADGTVSNLSLWDREEEQLAGKDDPTVTPDDELGFSPGGSASNPDDPEVKVVLPYEVNVVAFGDADTTTAVMSNLKLSVTVPGDADRGWGALDIQSTNATPQIWVPNEQTDGTPILPSAAGSLDVGNWTAHNAGDVGVVGFAIWQRSFAAQAGNYGRMIEHSTVSSDGR